MIFLSENLLIGIKVKRKFGTIFGMIFLNGQIEKYEASFSQDFLPEDDRKKYEVKWYNKDTLCVNEWYSDNDLKELISKNIIVLS